MRRCAHASMCTMRKSRIYVSCMYNIYALARSDCNVCYFLARVRFAWPRGERCMNHHRVVCWYNATQAQHILYINTLHEHDILQYIKCARARKRMMCVCVYYTCEAQAQHICILGGCRFFGYRMHHMDIQKQLPVNNTNG